jgi:hypothetical protein
MPPMRLTVSNAFLVALLGNAERFEDDETFADAEFVQQSLPELADR